MADPERETLLVLKHLRDHFAATDDHLRPPTGVRGVTPEREAVLLGDLYAGGYITALTPNSQCSPVIITGLTELGRLAAR